MNLLIPDSGFRIPDSGFRFPVSGFRIPDSGFRIPILESGFRFPGFRVAPGYTTQENGICDTEFVTRNLQSTI